MSPGSVMEGGDMHISRKSMVEREKQEGALPRSMTERLTGEFLEGGAGRVGNTEKLNVAKGPTSCALPLVLKAFWSRDAR